VNLDKIVEQVPSLGVLAFIVVQFLRHLRARDETLKEISDRCHDCNRDAQVCIQENSKVLGEVGTVLQRLNGKAKE